MIEPDIKLESQGLNQNDWAKLRNRFLKTGGQVDPHTQVQLEKLNEFQQGVINEFKLAIRSIKNEQ